MSGFGKRRGYRAPQERIAIAAKHGPDFCPGTNWSYSNAGYVLLARITEALDDRPFHESVQARILGPLKLERAVALAPKQTLERMARPHVDGKPDDFFVPSLPIGPGIPVADSGGAMVRFWGALLAGELLPRDDVAAAFRLLRAVVDPPIAPDRARD